MTDRVELPPWRLDRAIMCLRFEHGSNTVGPAPEQPDLYRSPCPAHSHRPGDCPLTIRAVGGPGGYLRYECEAGCLPSVIDEEVRRLEDKWLGAGLSGNSSSETGAGDRVLCFTPVSEIKPERTRWLWAGRVPFGGTTLLVGRQGLGKSMLALELAARLSRGELEGDLQGAPAGAFVVSYEDNAASTIVPRLTVAGVDHSRVRVVSAKRHGVADLVSLPDDVEGFRAAAHEHGVRLVIVDPLVASLPAEVNSHRDQDVRRALAPLALFAEEEDLAVLALIHFNKAPGTDAIARVSGAGAFTQAPRSVLAFGADPGDPEGEEGPARVLAHAKSNLAPRAPSLACRIEGRKLEREGDEPIPTARLVIGGECGTKAAELLEVRDADERSALDEACDFLRAELGEGPRLAEEVKSDARRADISDKTLRRAREKTCEKPYKKDFRGPWMWALSQDAQGGRAPSPDPEHGHLGRNGFSKRDLPPSTPPRTPEDAQLREMGNFEPADGNSKEWSAKGADDFLERAKQVFPGSYELARGGPT